MSCQSCGPALEVRIENSDGPAAQFAIRRSQTPFVSRSVSGVANRVLQVRCGACMWPRTARHYPMA